QDWTWQHPLPQGNSLSHVTAPDAATIVATGTAGTVLRSTDGGESWSVQYSAGSARTKLESVFFLNGNSGWIVGDRATILKTTDGGQTWQAKNNSRVAVALLDVAFAGTNIGWIVGENGVILK